MFLSTRRIDCLWPDLVRAWSDEGLLDSGEAHVLDVSPENVTHRYLMETESIPILPAVTWEGGLGDMEAVLTSRLTTRMYLPSAGPDVGEVMVDVILNHDDTVSVYVNVPCDEVCRGETPAIRQGRGAVRTAVGTPALTHRLAWAPSNGSRASENGPAMMRWRGRSLLPGATAYTGHDWP